MPEPQAIEVLGELLPSLQPQSLSERHDTLRLMGVVLSQVVLLEILTNPKAEDKDRVAAARLLRADKEDPTAIAERLKRSPLADLTHEQLQTIITRIKQGETDIQHLIQDVKESHDVRQP